MNLFYDPSIVGLRMLVDTADNKLPVHNIVVDFDGEVIIDPETKYEGISLHRFKYHTQITKAIQGNARSLKTLLDTLLAAYNNHHIELHRNLNSAA